MIQPSIDPWRKQSTGKQQKAQYQNSENIFKEMAGGAMKMNPNFAKTSENRFNIREQYMTEEHDLHLISAKSFTFFLNQVLQAIQEAEKVEKPSLADLFTDVYDKMPSNLQDQEKFVKEAVKRFPKEYPSDVPVQA